MNSATRLVITIAVFAAAATASAAPDAGYMRKRAIYDDMGKLRGQDALALGGLEKIAAHSKAWEAVLKRASKEFGEDHACYKATFFARQSWTSMTFAASKPATESISAIGSFGYQAGQSATECYDEIEKLDAPTAKR